MPEQQRIRRLVINDKFNCTLDMVANGGRGVGGGGGRGLPCHPPYWRKPSAGVHRQPARLLRRRATEAHRPDQSLRVFPSSPTGVGL